MRLIDAVEALDRYYQNGYPPGSFIESILKNDLFGMCNSADITSWECATDIVRKLYNDYPKAMYGSEEKVLRWMADDEYRNEIVSARARMKSA